MNKITKSIFTLLVFFVFFSGLSCSTQEQEINQIISSITKTYQVYAPLVIRAEPERPLYMIENEGVYWPSLAPYYPGEILTFSVNADWLEEKGWSYFDRKHEGYTGDIFLKFRGAYDWMVDPSCGPIPRCYWDIWVSEFAVPVIEHIGADQIRWAELLNEPDTSYAGAENFFGCWGDAYQDGAYYAEFINHVYPILKAEYPEIEFIAGAFMNPSSSFAYGVASELQTIDGVSFHFYPFCGSDYETKLAERYQAMVSLFDFPIYFSETNMIYDVQSAECDQDQAEYVDYLTKLEYNLEAVIVYTAGCNHWRNADLIYPCNPIHLKPAYQEFIER